MKFFTVNRSATSALPTSSRSSIASSREAALTAEKSPFCQRQVNKGIDHCRSNYRATQRLVYYFGMRKRRFVIDPDLAKEAKSIVAHAFRNGPIEDIHAGIDCPTCAGRRRWLRQRIGLRDHRWARIRLCRANHLPRASTYLQFIESPLSRIPGRHLRQA